MFDDNFSVFAALNNNLKNTIFPIFLYFQLKSFSLSEDWSRPLHLCLYYNSWECLCSFYTS